MNVGDSYRGTRGNGMRPETPFLLDLFDRLKKEGIRYCVERNYEGLPYDLCGHDLDLLILRSSMNHAMRIILSTAQAHGGCCTPPGSQVSGLRWVLCLGLTDGGHLWGLRIDLKPSISWKGVDIAEVD